MSISTEITRINTAVGNAYTAIQNKGGTLPVSQKVAGLADAIGTIPTGGSGATVTPLSVTENGTYTAPTGTAYSPVTVNVPTEGGGDLTEIEEELDEILNGVRRPVGGVIFYIDPNAGGEYKFYNANGVLVDAPTIGTDCTGWTYECRWVGSDKFYVLHNEKYTKAWGYSGTTIGASNYGFGGGRKNTAIALALGSYNSNSIWQVISDLRTNKAGGCDDWFIGSSDEVRQLKLSGVISSWSLTYTSNEVGNNSVVCWGTNSYSSNQPKTEKYASFAIRAF